MDSSTDPTIWNEPLRMIVANGDEITGVRGIPSMIQTSFGQRGNFDLVVPLRNGGFIHYFHDNGHIGRLEITEDQSIQRQNTKRFQ